MNKILLALLVGLFRVFGAAVFIAAISVISFGAYTFYHVAVKPTVEKSETKIIIDRALALKEAGLKHGDFDKK